MVSLTHFSDFKNFIKLNNKIPEYAREYKKEYLYIRGLNKEFEYFINKPEDISTYEFFHNKNVDKMIKLIEIFLKKQGKGKFSKDLRGLKFREKDIPYLIYFFENMVTQRLVGNNKDNIYYNSDLHNLFCYIYIQIKNQIIKD